jgi:hypothetical protein
VGQAVSPAGPRRRRIFHSFVSKRFSLGDIHLT